LDNFLNVTIKNNSSNINYNFNDTFVNITIPADAKVQTFEIIFIGYKNGEEESIVVSSESSGRGGGYCYRHYILGNWSECINGNQNRTLTIDLKKCYQIKEEKPIESQACSNETIVSEKNETIIQPEIKVEKKDKEFFLFTWIKWWWDKIIFWK